MYIIYVTVFVSEFTSAIESLKTKIHMLQINKKHNSKERYRLPILDATILSLPSNMEFISVRFLLSRQCFQTTSVIPV